MQRDRDSDDRVHDAFRDFLVAVVQDGRVGHQVADIAQEQQRAAMQRDHAILRIGRAGAGRVLAVRVQAAGERIAALGDGFRQRGLQDAQPVRVSQHLVLGVDRCDRVLEVEDGGQRGFDHEVGDAGRIALADRRVAVDDDVDMQAIVLQQHRAGRIGAALVSDELGCIGEAGAGAILQADFQRATGDTVAGGVGVAALCQRRGLVQQIAAKGDHFRAAHRVVALAAGAGAGGAVGLGNRVGAVQRIVEGTPAGVGGIERIAGVQDRHDQLRAGLDRQFGIDIVGGDGEVFRLRLHVAYGFQERAVSGDIADRSRVGAMPVVQLGLQPVALGQQRDVFRRQLMDDGVETLPEAGAVDAGAGQHLVFDEAVQRRCNLEPVDGGAFVHVLCLLVRRYG